MLQTINCGLKTACFMVPCDKPVRNCDEFAKKMDFSKMRFSQKSELDIQKLHHFFVFSVAKHVKDMYNNINIILTFTSEYL